jgi:drug/metabolite transporter (DMT)-like permease
LLSASCEASQCLEHLAHRPHLLSNLVRPRIVHVPLSRLCCFVKENRLSCFLTCRSSRFAANYTYNASLDYTSVSSSTIIAASVSLWTLLIGAMPLFRVRVFQAVMGCSSMSDVWLPCPQTETFSMLKLLAVLSCISGIALVTLVDRYERLHHKTRIFALFRCAAVLILGIAVSTPFSATNASGQHREESTCDLLSTNQRHSDHYSTRDIVATS